ncbi:MAG TPA: TolC family protein [Gemmatimonadales bacterium]|nr:TolC family protein [Gemmatimonadales bacterium]
MNTSKMILGMALLLGPSAGAAQAQQPVPQSGSAAAPVEWWAAVGDTTLVRLVRQALATNGDVRASEARVDQVRAVRAGAALDLVPSVTASAAYSRQRLPLASLPGVIERPPAYDYWDAGIEASWELDLFGRLRSNLRGRGELIGASEADQEEMELLVTAELAGTYVSLRGLQEQLAVARENAANQERTLELTRQRLEAGRGNELDTERAQAQLSSTLAAMVDLESRVMAEQYKVAVLTGGDPEVVAAELAAGGTFPSLPELGTPGNVEALARRRPDVVSAERQAAAAAAFQGAARADYLPRISLVGGIGAAANDFDRLGGTGTSRYAIGPVITWPLLNLGRVKASADAASAEREAAEGRYEQVVRRASEEIRTATVRYGAARARLVHLERAAQASRRAAELARLRFESGAADFLQVLDADRTRLAAEADLARGRAEAGGLLVEAYRAFAGVLP